MFLDTTIGNITEPVSGRQWGRQTILAQIDARSRRYHHEGIRAGDRVFLHFGNRLEFFADLLAIWRLGACAIPVDSRLTTFEVDKLIRVATPRVALVDEHVESPNNQKKKKKKKQKKKNKKTKKKQKTKTKQKQNKTKTNSESEKKKKEKAKEREEEAEEEEEGERTHPCEHRDEGEWVAL